MSLKQYQECFYSIHFSSFWLNKTWAVVKVVIVFKSLPSFSYWKQAKLLLLHPQYWQILCLCLWETIFPKQVDFTVWRLTEDQVEYHFTTTSFLPVKHPAFLDEMDVIKDHCRKEKHKHLSFLHCDTSLILAGWAHLLCLSGLLITSRTSGDQRYRMKAWSPSLFPVAQI